MYGALGRLRKNRVNQSREQQKRVASGFISICHVGSSLTVRLTICAPKAKCVGDDIFLQQVKSFLVPRKPPQINEKLHCFFTIISFKH